MADSTYQVVGECALATVESMYGRTKQLLYKGALFPADAPELQHNLDAGLVEQVGSAAEAGLNADGEVGEAQPKDDTVTADASAEGRQVRRGGRPSAAEKADLVDQAVAAGMDRAEAEKASVADLRSALKQQ